MPLELSNIDKRIIARLEKAAEEYAQLEEQMNDPAIASDPAKMARIAREYGKLKRQADGYREYEKLHRQWQEAMEMQQEEGLDEEMKQLAAEEAEELARQIHVAIDQVKESLVMSNDAAIDSIIMEIRAGTGGAEAALFAGDLYGMYNHYCEKKGWKVETISFSAAEMGGFKEIIFGVKGKGVWQHLGYEGGGHRVQRVPETESQGRIHTSAATVAVLPEPEELEIDIKPDDVIEHVCRSSGPGGQSVNKLNSAIKLEHIPTGITVSMQDEKSQHKNRAKAWRILRSRIYEHIEQEKRAARDSERRDMIGSGDRSQRIRTYNFPQNRITDHRINFTMYKLDKAIMGEIDELIQALIEYDKQRRLENL